MKLTTELKKSDLNFRLNDVAISFGSHHLVVLISVIIFLTLSFKSQAQVKDSTENIFTLENCVNVFDENNVVETKVGYQYWFVDKQFLDGRTLKMSVVEPKKATHPPHKHLEDEFFFVLEGKAQFFLNGETKEAGAYASFYCPSGSLHGIINVGETTLKYLVIKKYILDK